MPSYHERVPSGDTRGKCVAFSSFLLAVLHKNRKDQYSWKQCKWIVDALTVACSCNVNADCVSVQSYGSLAFVVKKK